jgi:hypothetical protein
VRLKNNHVTTIQQGLINCGARPLGGVKCYFCAPKEYKNDIFLSCNKYLPLKAVITLILMNVYFQFDGFI